MPRTIEYCLAKLGVAPDSLGRCADLTEEWSTIKRAYFKTALKTHPDKGGDAATFRKVQAAFGALRSHYDGAGSGFLFSCAAAQPVDQHSAIDPEMNTPSWEFYAEAAQEVVPMYHVERAKSSRSRCQAKGSAQSSNCGRDDFISKDELRVGWMSSESGMYGSW